MPGRRRTSEGRVRRTRRGTGGAFTTLVCLANSLRGYKAVAATYALSEGWRLIEAEDVAPVESRAARESLPREVQEILALTIVDGRPRTVAEWSLYPATESHSDGDPLWG